MNLYHSPVHNVCLALVSLSSEIKHTHGDCRPYTKTCRTTLSLSLPLPHYTPSVFGCSWQKTHSKRHTAHSLCLPLSSKLPPPACPPLPPPFPLSPLLLVVAFCVCLSLSPSLSLPLSLSLYVSLCVYFSLCCLCVCMCVCVFEF